MMAICFGRLFRSILAFSESITGYLKAANLQKTIGTGAFILGEEIAVSH